MWFEKFEMKNNFFLNLSSKSYFFLIAGPCVIEDEKSTYQIAKHLKKITKRLNLPFIFKASFDKANRSSVDSFRGPGLEDGLKILKNIKKKLNILITSDIHLPSQAQKASEVLDIIQIPAFLCRQTDLILSALNTGKPVNIKKGQFLSPVECDNIINKAKKTNNRNISIIERGNCFGYNNLVVDFRSIYLIKKLNVPVIFDATHSVQLPGAGKGISSGESMFIPILAKAAIATGADGLFIETHPEPKKALCDGPNSLPLNKLESLLSTLINIKKATER